MLIERVTLAGFGRFADEIHFELQPGLNLLTAPNEAGKSTLLAGIVAVLFGLPAREGPFSQGRWRSWGSSGPFWGELSLVVGGVRYTIRRQFASHQVSVVCQMADGPLELMSLVHNPEARRRAVRYEEWLAETLGLADRGLFEATFWFAQPLPLPGQLDETVQQLLAGAGQGGFAGVLDRLVEQVRGLTRATRGLGLTSRDGLKEQLYEELLGEEAALRSAMAEAVGAVDQFEQVSQGLAVAEAQVAEARAALVSQTALVEAFREWRRLSDELEQRLGEVAGLERSLGEVRRLEAELAAAAGAKGSAVGPVALGLAGLVGLGAGLAGLVGLGAGLAGFGWPFASGGAVLLLAAVVLWLRGQQGRSALRQGLGRELAARLDERRVADADGLGALLEERRLAALAVQQALAELRADHPGLPQQVAEAEGLYRAAQAEVAHWRSALSLAEAEVYRLKGTLASLQGQEPLNLAQAELRLAELRDERRQLEAQIEALVLAHNEMAAALASFGAGSRGRLADRATAYFRSFTGDVGRRVAVTETFEVMVVEHGGKLVEPSSLSQGAQDQLFLALRLAIADLVAGEVSLPLLLDDPFVNCDDERLSRIMAALHQVDRQIILVGHRTPPGEASHPLL